MIRFLLGSRTHDMLSVWYSLSSDGVSASSCRADMVTALPRTYTTTRPGSLADLFSGSHQSTGSSGVNSLGLRTTDLVTHSGTSLDTTRFQLLVRTPHLAAYTGSTPVSLSTPIGPTGGVNMTHYSERVNSVGPPHALAHQLSHHVESYHKGNMPDSSPSHT